MKTEDAVARNAEAQRRGSRARVFDWNTAARRIVESGAKVAGAGLAGDWEWTGGDIYRGGKPVPREETYTYLASLWAAPELQLDGMKEDCWVFADETSWNENTYWPDSAVAILEAAATPSA